MSTSHQQSPFWLQYIHDRPPVTNQNTTNNTNTNLCLVGYYICDRALTHEVCRTIPVGWWMFLGTVRGVLVCMWMHIAAWCCSCGHPSSDIYVRMHLCTWLWWWAFKNLKWRIGLPPCLLIADFAALTSLDVLVLKQQLWARSSFQSSKMLCYLPFIFIGNKCSIIVMTAEYVYATLQHGWWSGCSKLWLV